MRSRSHYPLTVAVFTAQLFWLSACGGTPVETTDIIPSTAAATPDDIDSNGTNGSNSMNESGTGSESGSGSSSGSESGSGTGTSNNAGGDPNSTPVSGPVGCNAEPSLIQQRMLQLINDARAQARSCGSTAFAATTSLSWNNKLADAATGHSADMTQHNFFDHTGSDGSSVGMRVTAAGYTWQAVGENIAAGQNTAQGAVDGWLASAGHCRNLMDPDFTEVSVACSEDSAADYTRYWTNVLAKPF